MKVILNNDVENLGEEGDICTVKPGYARNFLLPKGLVLEFNDRNLALIEERRAVIEERKALKHKQAASIKERIESEPLKISMTAGTNGKLFGSVNAAMIAERLAAQGIEIERKRIDIPENTLKTVGNFKVRIKLYGDQEATLTVAVVASNAREIEKEIAKEEAKTPSAEAPEAESRTEAEETAETAEETPQDPEVMAMRAAAEEEVSTDSEDKSADSSDA